MNNQANPAKQGPEGDPCWGTPPYLIDRVARHLSVGFTLDVCANPETAKCEFYWTEKEDGLQRSWDTPQTAWCNPPWDKSIELWVEKAYREMRKGNDSVMLIPARISLPWWSKYIPKCAKLIHLRGRIRFIDSRPGPGYGLPGSSCPEDCVLIHWTSAGPRCVNSFLDARKDAMIDQPGLFDEKPKPWMDAQYDIYQRAIFAIRGRYKRECAKRKILRYFLYEAHGLFIDSGKLNSIFSRTDSTWFCGLQWHRRLQELGADGLIETRINPDPKRKTNLWGIPTERNAK